MYETHPDTRSITQLLLAVAREVVAAEEQGIATSPVTELPEHVADPWVLSLIDRAILGPTDVTILRILLAAESEPIAYRLLQRLAGDPTQPGVAIDALITVMRTFGTISYDVLHALRPGASLVERGLVQVHGEAKIPSIVRRVTMPDRLVDYLVTGATPAPLARPVLSVEPVLDGPLCPVMSRDGGDETVLDQVRRALPRVIAGQPLWLTGVPGSGRKTVLAKVAHELGYQLLVVSCEELLGMIDAKTCATLWCELLVNNAILCVADADSRLATTRTEESAIAKVSDVLGALYGILQRAHLPMVFTSDQPPLMQELESPPDVIRFGGATPFDTLQLWKLKLPRTEEIEEISTKFRLAPGRIVRIAEGADKIANARGRDVVVHHDISQAVSMSVAQQVAVLGTLVEDSQTWDDIVLPPETKDSVDELMARVRHRHTVLDRWGFRRKMSKGLGMAALFSGPPGTGKTMIASLIAKELGQELYQIDLSRVVSKWIGETEKNLARVFDAAEGANVLLLFDEADSLFAKRTEVKSSNDKHSNAEVNYLLQRVERFEGICILTTNFEGSIDPAFKRRLAFRMIFALPDENERAELWRRMMPKSAEVANDLDYRELGREFELAGGNIRNAVLRAAFLAASEKTPIHRELVMRAVRLEYRDAGKFTTAGRIT